MTVLDTPENHHHAADTIISSASPADQDRSLRRRTAVAAAAAEPDRAPAGSSPPELPQAVVAESEKTNGINGEQHNEGNSDRDNDNGVNSNDKVENRGVVSAPDIKFTYRPSVPAHRNIKESPLSSDAIFRQSHAGLFNLCVVVLIAVNSRLIIENLMKYGWLIKTGFWFSSKSLRDWPLFMCCLTLPLFALASYVVEKLAYRNCVSEFVAVTLHIVITTSAIVYPVSVILSCDSAFLSGVTLMLFACIVWLKLVSYAHTNHDMRTISKSRQKDDVSSVSPNTDCSYDVNLKSLAYFMVAPTLCYQTSYPRSACIRKGWVVRQFVKLIIFMGFMGFIIEQYINPIVQNSQHPLKGDLLYGLERVLKLSVPNLYVWLCMFYCLFHLWLNILAELLRFGDREFYKDWWNAKTVEEYWRMWNMPVHKWMVRHIYFPCLRNNIPRVTLLIGFNQYLFLFFLFVSFLHCSINMTSLDYCDLTKYLSGFSNGSDELNIKLMLALAHVLFSFNNNAGGSPTYCFLGFSHLSRVMHCRSLPYFQALGFYRDYVSGSLGRDHKFSSKQVQKLYGTSFTFSLFHAYISLLVSSAFH
ncbi:Diacylglycerol O-acyltransferase 1 [Turnera subulata]|uniref:O-acyltransferase n=1 Tax=Turnera subulata TaxID=218843 RepID=A0A9Q0GLP0_9ROSI|nr:Diacylglycerol O-acyltransferase 1 [Turnera subulata]